ncbi:MAG: cyclic nucleotide-binding domain-containing protein [Candidatus Sericytochromatia bacterium]
MNKNEIKTHIKEHLFFKHFKENEIDILEKCASIKNFEEDDFLTTIREEAKVFYLITNGSVTLQLFSHEKGIIELEKLESEDLLGWSWLIAPYKWHFDAIAVEKTQAICFDAVAIKKEMENNTEFGYKMYKIFTPIIIERIQAERKNLLDIYGSEVYEIYSREMVTFR